MGERLLKATSLNDENEMKYLDAFEKQEGKNYVENCKEMINDIKQSNPE